MTCWGCLVPLVLPQGAECPCCSPPICPKHTQFRGPCGLGWGAACTWGCLASPPGPPSSLGWAARPLPPICDQSLAQGLPRAVWQVGGDLGAVQGPVLPLLPWVCAASPGRAEPALQGPFDEPAAPSHSAGLGAPGASGRALVCCPAGPVRARGGGRVLGPGAGTAGAAEFKIKAGACNET